MSADYLFSEYDLRAVLEANLAKAKELVEQISAKEFGSSPDEAVVDHVLSTAEILPLEIYEAHKEVEHAETQVDVSRDVHRAFFSREQGPFFVPGLQVAVSLPFTGDLQLFQCRPSTYMTVFPRAEVLAARDRSQGGKLELHFAEPTDTLGDGTKLKDRIDRELTVIRKYVGYVNVDVQAHNVRLRPHIEQCVKSRRTRLLAYGSVLEKLNIPLKRREGAPDLSAITLKKRSIRPLPPPSKAKPDYAIRDEDFEYILKVIRHEGRSFEATPATFAKHGEEELRDIMLAHLNGHYEGQATGETFRRAGKTDIRIEYENRAAFVAECKLWTGQKGSQEAVEQLLGYLTWRDCKAALVVFNTRVAGFQDIQQKLAQALNEHNRFIGAVHGAEPGEWRFQFRGLDEGDRPVTLHVFLFNLFVARA